MSVEKDVRELAIALRAIEKLVLRGQLPDQPVLFENQDGSEDIARFVADYNCTPDEALERGATHIILRIHLKNPANIQPLSAYARFPDPNYVAPPMPAPPPAAQVIPAGEPDPFVDSLADSLLRQARDKAAARDKRRAGNAGN